MRPYRINPQVLRRSHPSDRRLQERELMLDELERLRSENAELRSELRELSPPEPEPALEVERLSRRVIELTRDLERVQQRSNDEVENARAAERSRQLAGLGEVLDSVTAGLAMNAGAPDSWRAGLLGIQQQLLAFFRAAGATVTPTLGDAYDPRLHEAIAVLPSTGLASGHIARIVRHGIVLEGDHVARTAQVCIAA